jgi:hypothetical protein
MNSDLRAANTRAAIRRGQRRRMAYYTDYGLRSGQRRAGRRAV